MRIRRRDLAQRVPTAEIDPEELTRNHVHLNPRLLMVQRRRHRDGVVDGIIRLLPRLQRMFDLAGQPVKQPRGLPGIATGDRVAHLRVGVEHRRLVPPQGFFRSLDAEDVHAGIPEKPDPLSGHHGDHGFGPLITGFLLERFQGQDLIAKDTRLGAGPNRAESCPFARHTGRHNPDGHDGWGLLGHRDGPSERQAKCRHVTDHMIAREDRHRGARIIPADVRHGPEDRGPRVAPAGLDQNVLRGDAVKLATHLGLIILASDNEEMIRGHERLKRPLIDRTGRTVEGLLDHGSARPRGIREDLVRREESRAGATRHDDSIGAGQVRLGHTSGGFLQEDGQLVDDHVFLRIALRTEGVNDGGKLLVRMLLKDQPTCRQCSLAGWRRVRPADEVGHRHEGLREPRLIAFLIDPVEEGVKLICDTLRRARCVERRFSQPALHHLIHGRLV